MAINYANNVGGCNHSFAEIGMKDILVIKHGSLGDIVQALGAMKVIRLRHPEDKITIMTTDAYRKLIMMTGFFDDVIIDNRPHYELKNWYRVCKKVLADKEWAVVYDLQLSRRTRRYWRISRFLTKYPTKWAFWQKAKEKTSGFDFYETPAKKRFSFCKPVKHFEKFDFPPPSMDFCKGEEENFYLLPEKYALILPGCSAKNAYKRWSPEKFAELVQRLEKDDLPSVILGTSAEEAEINLICEKSEEAVNFMNKASIYDIPALAKNAAVVIGNDTGPTHIAAFSKADTVCLFCKKNISFAMDMPNVINIIKNDINNIEVAEVYDAVQKLLSAEKETEEENED